MNTTRSFGPRLPRPAVLAQGLLLVVVLVWGTTFSLVKSALPDASPLLFNFLRMALAFLLLLTLNWRALRRLDRRIRRLALLAGVFLGLGYELQTAGLAFTQAAKSAFITNLVVVMVPPLSAVPGVRPRGAPAPSSRAYAGAVVAFAGLLLLTATGISRWSDWLAGFGFGEWLTLGCAAAFAAHLLTLARAAAATEGGAGVAGALGTVQIGTAAALMLVLLPLGGRPVLHISARLLWALAITAVLATAAAFTVQSWAQRYLSSAQTALLFTLEPIFAWLTALLFFGERLGARQLAGAALILGGVLLSELPGRRPVLETMAPV